MLRFFIRGHPPLIGKFEKYLQNQNSDQRVVSKHKTGNVNTNQNVDYLEIHNQGNSSHENQVKSLRVKIMVGNNSLIRILIL